MGWCAALGEYSKLPSGGSVSFGEPCSKDLGVHGIYTIRLFFSVVSFS